KKGAKALHVGDADVGSPDDRDLDPRPVDSGGGGRGRVVDLSEIRGCHVVITGAAVEKRSHQSGPLLRRQVDPMEKPAAVKVVERDWAGGEPRDPARKRDLERVGLVELAVNLVTTDRRCERLLHLADRSRKLNPAPPAADGVDSKTLAREPIDDLLDVFVGQAETLSELLRSQPPVVVGRSRVLLAREQSLELPIAAGTASQRQKHSVHGRIRVGGPSVPLRSGRWRHAAGKHDRPIVGGTIACRQPRERRRKESSEQDRAEADAGDDLPALPWTPRKPHRWNDKGRGGRSHSREWKFKISRREFALGTGG